MEIATLGSSKGSSKKFVGKFTGLWLDFVWIVRGFRFATVWGLYGKTCRSYLQLFDYGKRTFQDVNRIHAVYGGLHISPFGGWNEKLDETVRTFGELGIKHFGCNHCTGENAVRRLIELGMPIAKGLARNGSKSDLYPSNGDTFELEV